MRDVPEVWDFESQYDISGTEASGSIEWMPRREIHPLPSIHDGRLQKLRQLDQQLETIRRSCGAARYDKRVFGRDQNLSDVRNGRRIARGCGRDGQFWDVQPA